MMRRSSLTVLLAIAAVYLMAPLQQWPASTILFDDGVILQDRYDDLCKDAIMLGAASVVQVTSTASNNVFVPMVYSDTGQGVTYDPHSCWSEAGIGKIEYVYNCGDGLSRDFTVKLFVPTFPSSGQENVRAFLGVHAGGAVVDGDEDQTVINQFTIPGNNFKLVTVSAKFTLDEGDHVAPGFLQAAGAPGTFNIAGYELLFIQSGCLGDTL